MADQTKVFNFSVYDLIFSCAFDISISKCSIL